MSALPDASTLRSMALTCASFYDILKGAESMVTGNVVMNDVGIDILPEAIAALESRDLFLAPEELPEFASRQFKSRQVHQRLRRLSTALSMSEFYQHVLHFAADFAIIFVRSSSLADSEIPADWPSRSEKSRIKRALYRFEIYCNMFKVGISLPSIRESKMIFSSGASRIGKMSN
jgi:hypothetical protein